MSIFCCAQIIDFENNAIKKWNTRAAPDAKHEEIMGFDHVDKIQTTPYPQWICSPCGNKWGNKECGIATWHNDECGICKTFSFVTEPRDFGHLKKGWDK